MIEEKFLKLDEKLKTSLEYILKINISSLIEEKIIKQANLLSNFSAKNNFSLKKLQLQIPSIKINAK